MANVTDFVQRLTEQVIDARDKGDAATLNALTADPAVAHFVNNVVLIPTMREEQYRHWYAGNYARLTVLAEQYEQAEQQRAKVDTLESRLANMERMLSALLEAQSAKAKAAVAAAVAVVEDDAQTDETPDEPEPEADTPRADDAQEDDPAEDTEEAE